MSPPPDYTKAMSSMSLGRGPLDDVAGIPKRGEPSMLGGLMGGEFTQSDDHLGEPSASSHADELARGVSHAVTSDRPADPQQSRHARMSSDLSINSSHTMTSLRQPPLSPVDHRDVYDSPTTPTGSDTAPRFTNRKSMDSIKSLPVINSRDPIVPSPTDGFGSTRSSTSRPSRVAPPASFVLSTPRTSLRSITGSLNRSNSSARAAALRSMPQVYPALLSQVANAFRQLISLAELNKEGITYKEAFDGRSAVTIIADIIKTPDRNLALLLGRALDAQKYFHDVTYDHRLRDNPNEVYRFRERLAAPFISDEVTDSPSSEHVGLHRNASARPTPSRYTSETGSIQTSESNMSFFNTPATSSTSLVSPKLAKLSSVTSLPNQMDDTDDDMPSGVFTLLTDCYSPTCSRENLCYSINCPRRLEQMKRLNMKPQPGLTRKISEESLHDVKVGSCVWLC